MGLQYDFVTSRKESLNWCRVGTEGRRGDIKFGSKVFA